MNSLTESQARNLALLSEVGTLIYTQSIRLEAPREWNDYEVHCGFRQIIKSKSDHKGFNMTTLLSLSDKGLINWETTQSGTLDSGNGTPDQIGQHATTVWVFTAK